MHLHVHDVVNEDLHIEDIDGITFEIVANY